jgi:CS domain
VEAAHQFFHTKEFVFINFNMKGYSKLTDVRYALSQNELLVEIKEPSTQRVHRLCKTLFKEVNVELSSVELLIDFIAVKLRKDDKDIAWDQLGYDIKEFTIPKRGQMKSNFLSLPPIVREEPKVQHQVEE